MSYSLALKIKRTSKSNPAFGFDRLPKKIGLRQPLYNFQVQGMFYLMAAKKAILADATGLGKTAQCIGLIHLLEYQKRENNRWIIVATPSTMYQWEEEFIKFGTLPPPVLGCVERRERIAHYVTNFWQTYIISYQTLLRDWDIIRDLGIPNWIFDDAHFFRHHSTKTAVVIKSLTKNANRVILSTATPMQKSPMDIHSLLESLGLTNVFGSMIGFENHYCVMRKVRIFLRSGQERFRKEFVRARNLDELRKRLYPYIIQRRFKDVGKELPSLIVKPVWLPLTPQQAELQKQIHQKTLQMWAAGQTQWVRNTGFHRMRQICAGTRTAEFPVDFSSKLDAIEQFIEDKLGGEKVLIYSFYKETVRVIAERLQRAGRTDFAVITGDVSDKRERETIKQRFLHDPKLKILIGTDTIKVGLNLQSARYLLCVDLILNAQEITQLIGRIRRLGSTVDTVVVYFLLTKGTLEERLWGKLKYESALFDCIFRQRSEVFQPLTDTEMATLLELPVRRVNETKDSVKSNQSVLS